VAYSVLPLRSTTLTRQHFESKIADSLFIAKNINEATISKKNSLLKCSIFQELSNFGSPPPEVGDYSKESKEADFI
jgi:hypothetical protein